jgi:hypothetical protein
VAQALAVTAEARAARLAAQLSAAIARPLDHFDPSAFYLPPLSSEALAALAVHPAFRPGLERALSRELRLGETAIDGAFLARLAERPATRLAVLVASQPMARVREAGVVLAAAALHPAVVGLVLKVDRARVAAVFGEPAFLMATQEAPLLHAALADLAAGIDPAPILGPGRDPAAARERLAGLGLAILARVVEVVEPALAALVQGRLPPAVAEEAARLPPPAPERCEQVVKLLRRRIEAWSATIG